MAPKCFVSRRSRPALAGSVYQNAISRGLPPPSPFVSNIMGADCPDLHNVGVNYVDEAISEAAKAEREGTKSCEIANLWFARTVRVTKDCGNDIGQQRVPEARVVARELLQIPFWPQPSPRTRTPRLNEELGVPGPDSPSPQDRPGACPKHCAGLEGSRPHQVRRERETCDRPEAPRAGRPAGNGVLHKPAPG